METGDSASKKIVDNVIFTAIARISMALTLPVVTFLFILLQMVYTSDLERIQSTAKADNSLIQQQLVTQQQTFDRQMGDVLKRLGELTTLSNNSLTNHHQNQNRISILESNRAQDAGRLTSLENLFSSKFDRLTDAVSGINNRLAELTVEARGRIPAPK